MKYFLLNKKGYTLIEIFIVLTLLGIIITPFISFFIGNMTAFHRADDEIEVQYQGQIALGTFVEKIIESKGIYKAYRKDGMDITSSTQNNSISKIIFLKDGENICFERKYNGLWYGKDHWANVVCANFIEDLQIEPIENSYKNCRGIKITMIIKKNNIKLSVANKIFFRNE